MPLINSKQSILTSTESHVLTLWLEKIVLSPYLCHAFGAGWCGCHGQDSHYFWPNSIFCEIVGGAHWKYFFTKINEGLQTTAETKLLKIISRIIVESLCTHYLVSPVFTCVYTILWCFNQTPFFLQTVEFDEGAGAVLRIQPLRAPRDENIYECVAENSEGEISVQAKLTIIRGKTAFSDHIHTVLSVWVQAGEKERRLYK